jgi:TetR/AcrR family transcriptional regulator, mexJK operon transcriptional repressor
MPPADGSGSHRSEARRRAILEAAKAVFLEKGFERASLSEIISRSGGSRSTVYEQFGGKDGLFATVMAEECADLLATLDLMTRSEGKPPREVLAHVGRRFLDMQLSPQGQAIFRLVLAESPRFPQVADTFLRVSMFPIRDRLRQYLDSLKAAGRVTVADTALAASLFLSMVSAEAPFHLACRAPFSSDTLEIQIQTAVEIFLHGIERIGTLV